MLVRATFAAGGEVGIAMASWGNPLMPPVNGIYFPNKYFGSKYFADKFFG